MQPRLATKGLESPEGTVTDDTENTVAPDQSPTEPVVVTEEGIVLIATGINTLIKAVVVEFAGPTPILAYCVAPLIL